MTDRLFAPWRSEYIMDKAPLEEGCIFCMRIDRERDKEDFILKRSTLSIVMLNIYPYSNGHLMVLPKRHIPDLSGLTDDEHLDLMRLIVMSKAVLQEVMHTSEFNIGLNLGRNSGAGIIDHVHWHIVPRWQGDSNFMHTISDCRVLPQSLEETYSMLKECWERMYS